MLKRDDLAKQFELVVKQEIKNHNDQMLATNISINEMKEILKAQANLYENELAKFHHRQVIQEIELGNSKQAFCELSEKFERFINDMNAFSEKCKSEIKLSVENSVNAHSKNEASLNIINSLDQKLEDLTDSVVGLSFNFSKEIEDASKSLKKEIEKSKKEILSLPSEAQAVKKELQDQMSIDRVDFTGLIREVNICKKTSMIIEKNIENLYTHIERLKAGN